MPSFGIEDLGAAVSQGRPQSLVAAPVTRTGLIVAMILFVLDALGLAARINLTPLGLAFVAGALLTGVL